MNRVLMLGRCVNAVVVCGFTGAYVYVRYNSFEKCKEMLQARKNDPFLRLPPHVNKLVNEVMSEMKLEETVRSKIKFFLSETADFVSHGSVLDDYGAVLGVPEYFLIDQGIEVKYTLAEKNKFTDVMNSQALDDSLRLSLQAKKFAIARELYELLYPYTNLLYSAPLAFSLKCLFYSYLLEKFSKIQPKSTLYLSHSLVLILGLALYALIFDLTILYAESNADFMATDLGSSYITGGIEYYTKMIKKNIALKKLDKNAPYSEDGDVNFSLFGKHHMPLQLRLKYLNDLKEMKQSKPSVWSYIMQA